MILRMIGSLLGFGRMADIGVAILNFLGSTAGMIAIVVVGALVIDCSAKNRGRKEAAQQCRAEAISAELTEARRQLVAARKVAEDDDRMAEQDSVSIVELSKRIETYEKELGDPGSCVVSRHLRDRVQSIRNSK